MTMESVNQDLQTLLVNKSNQLLNYELTVTRLERELAEATAAACTHTEDDDKKKAKKS